MRLENIENMDILRLLLNDAVEKKDDLLARDILERMIQLKREKPERFYESD